MSALHTTWIAGGYVGNSRQLEEISLGGSAQMPLRIAKPKSSPQPSGRRRASRLSLSSGILLWVSVGITGIAVASILGAAGAAREWSTLVGLTAALWLCTYFVTSWMHFGTPYLFTTAYVGPLAIFHLSWVFLDALGSTKVLPFSQGTLTQWFPVAGWYVIASLGALGVGFAVAIRKACHPTKSGGTQKLVVSKSLAWLFWLGCGLLAASTVFFIMFIAAVGNPLEYARHAFFETDVAGRGLGAFLMVFPGAVVALVIGASNSRQRLFAWCLAASAVLLIIWSGYRSQVFYPILLGGVLLVKTGRRIPWWITASVIFVIIILIPAISVFRTLEYGRIDTNVIEESINATSAEDGFVQLGGTLTAVATTLQVIPEKADYQYGWSYVLGIWRSIPNISSEMETSMRLEGFQKQKIDPKAIFDLSPSDWLTFLINPWAYQKGHGVGFSAISEPYINFGLPGVLLYFTFIGYVLGRLDTAFLLHYPWVLLMCSTTGWAFLRTTRNTFENFTKPVIFTLVIVLLWLMISRMIPSRLNPVRR